MLMRTHFAALIAGLMATAAAAAPLSAQTDQNDPHLRNDCRLAAQVLTTGHPAPHYDWALEFIPRCGEDGATALTHLWRNPPADEGRLNSLFVASYTLRDSRVTAAAVEAAANRTLPQPARLAALRVLAGHAVPQFLISTADLLRQESDTTRYSFPRVDHVNVQEGANPVGPSTIRTILATLESVGRDPDASVAYAASRTRRQVCMRLRSDDCS